MWPHIELYDASGIRFINQFLQLFHPRKSIVHMHIHFFSTQIGLIFNRSGLALGVSF
jgi:hypothetical protein